MLTLNYFIFSTGDCGALASNDRAESVIGLAAHLKQMLPHKSIEVLESEIMCQYNSTFTRLIEDGYMDEAVLESSKRSLRGAHRKRRCKNRVLKLTRGRYLALMKQQAEVTKQRTLVKYIACNKIELITDEKILKAKIYNIRFGHNKKKPGNPSEYLKDLIRCTNFFYSTKIAFSKNKRKFSWDKLLTLYMEGLDKIRTYCFANLGSCIIKTDIKKLLFDQPEQIIIQTAFGHEIDIEINRLQALYLT